MNVSQVSPSRRGLLAGALSLPLLGVAAPLRAAAGPVVDVTDPQHRLQAYMLMRGALDEDAVISCITCEYFGVVDGIMTPFYDLVAATFARFRAAKNGGYDAVSFEIEYFLDRQTGEVLDKWRNPYSGEIVTSAHNDSVPVRYKIDTDTRLALPPALLFAGAQVARETPLFEFAGDDVWVKEKTIATVPVAGAKPMQFNEMVTYHAKSSELARAGATRIRADVAYVGVSSFRPWQAMGDRRGHIIGYGVGGSGLAIADLPPRWLSVTKRLHPEALVNPGAYLEPLWKTL